MPNLIRVLNRRGLLGIDNMVRLLAWGLKLTLRIADTCETCALIQCARHQLPSDVLCFVQLQSDILYMMEICKI